MLTNNLPLLLNEREGGRIMKKILLKCIFAKALCPMRHPLCFKPKSESENANLFLRKP